MNQKTTKRRGFLKSTTAGAAALSAGVFSETAARAADSPNEKLKILCVGTANRANADISGVRGEEIVGLCDVDSKYLEKAASQFKSAAKYSDYREMIAEQSDKADAIVVATADHSHAPASLLGINAGLHCYCEKPLTHTVTEARMIAEAAKRKGVATQMGTQIHAGDNYRRVVEIIRSKVLGDISKVHVWVGKTWGGGELADKGDKVPANLDWDLWLGPAQERPFVAGAYHPANWRRWWAFGQGTLGDMGCHYMDLPFWALDLRHPTSIRAEGPEVNPETTPVGLKVDYKFPGVDLTWYDGNMIPKVVEGQRVRSSGIMFVGSEGMMFADYGSYKFFPKDKSVPLKAPEPTIPSSIGHHQEWIKACKEGTPTTCNFDYSGALSETVLLGNVAYRTGKELQWDAKNLKATNCPEADQYLTKEYRKGWEVAVTA